jgi:hypothetical protein
MVAARQRKSETLDGRLLGGDATTGAVILYDRFRACHL